jgi:NAD(P)H dehydrogenase (quinone)
MLITGAAGKTGRAVLQALAQRDLPVRALVRRNEQVDLAKSLGAGDVVVGDMRDGATLSRATRDVQAVYFICPNMAPDEFEMGKLAISAAIAAGVSHFVYHSVLHPQVEAMPHHWSKMRVEEHLFESGLPFTILQPAAYMQNVLSYWDEIQAAGVFRVPYPVETRTSMVDLDDVAQAAAIVLAEPGHTGATYELSGPHALSQRDVAQILSRELGFPVRAESISILDWQSNARATGLGDYQVETLSKMFRYYESQGFEGNSNVLSWILGRPATCFVDYVRRFLAGAV